MDIAGKTAFITGGASGLGAATTSMVHGAGGNVVIVDVSADNGEALAKRLGERALFCRADVTDSEQMAAAVQQGTERFGALHFAVCCAGIGPPKRVLGRDGVMPLDAFTRVINVNLVGSFNALRLAAEVIARNTPDAGGERGVVVMTASVAAFEGQIGQAAYSASKGGIVGMTLPIAREFASQGIRVMTIAPGLFDTPLLAGLPEDAKASLGQQVPFPSRLGQPEEYAEMVREVIAMPMLNGSVIRLDGAIRMAPR
ncbi:MAG TPA: SDR family NAD(P)-dependent oxidoreductase [bacterium]|nr:SDR family NAD(P)-dependent oxidoreductase [bacterium]